MTDAPALAFDRTTRPQDRDQIIVKLERAEQAARRARDEHLVADFALQVLEEFPAATLAKVQFASTHDPERATAWVTEIWMRDVQVWTLHNALQEDDGQNTFEAAESSLKRCFERRGSFLEGHRKIKVSLIALGVLPE